MASDKLYIYMCDSPLPDDVLRCNKGLKTIIRKDAERSLVHRVLARMLYALFMEK